MLLLKEVELVIKLLMLSPSDLDLGIKVSPEKFDELWEAAFGNANVGSAKWKTGQRALEAGKITTGDVVGYKQILRKLKNDILKKAPQVNKVDISIIKRGGKFDNGIQINTTKN